MIDTEARLKAALADRYRLEHELGAGGMATVYLAHDVRHDRKVALKVLRPELAAIIGAARFLHEIKTTANLQHAHILPLFDSGEVDGTVFYVMPLVEGESLRDLLVREKQLPVDDAVRITREVASALDYAHRHGVIHRDMKPENILLHDGQALVADFGIALAASAAGGTRMTETGLSLGTPHYMSPEQAMGERQLDARTDIYALGCVLYEMLVGEPPFTGPTAQAIVAKVITEKPPLVTALRDSVPRQVASATQKALAKLPADRFHSAAEFAEALSGRGLAPTGTESLPASAGPTVVRRPRWVAAAAVTVLLAALAAGWALRGLLTKPPPTSPIRFAFTLGQPGVGRPFLAISPDGRRVIRAFADNGGTERVFVRDLASTEVVPVPGTEGASEPTFSPDGEWILFSAGRKLRKVPTRGGPAIDLTESTKGAASWGPDGTIAYNTFGASGLWRVSASGGSPQQLTSLDSARREFSHWYPDMLPDGKAVIFTNFSTPIERSRIEAYEFGARKRTVLIEGAIFGRYSPSGHLLYVRDGAIFAVRFDPSSLKVLGTAVPVLDEVAWSATDGLAGFAVARSGTLVYLKASEWNVDSRVVWVGRDGHEEPAMPDSASFFSPRLSPDGKWIVFSAYRPKRDLWLYELGRKVLTRLTRAEASAFSAIWMPDSRSVVHSLETPVYDLYRIAIDGSAPERPMVVSPWDKHVFSMAATSGLLAYMERLPLGDRIMLAPLDGSSAPRPFGDTLTAATHPAFSPDGKWIAYTEMGGERSEVYLRAVDGSGGRRQVSVNGGQEPRWTRGGREIIYRRGNEVIAVPVNPATGAVGTALVLFKGRYLIGNPSGSGLNIEPTYDVTPDGTRFLMIKPLERPGAQPTVVVLNWFLELERKAGK